MKVLCNKQSQILLDDGTYLQYISNIFPAHEERNGLQDNTTKEKYTIFIPEV